MWKDYATFEREFSEAARWEDKVRVCLEGIFNNVFFRGAKFISDLNMETLKIRIPELYETVEDDNIRRALVISEMFKVAYKAAILHAEGIELELDINSYGWVFLTSIRQRDFNYSNELYGGKDAVKVFFKSVFFIAEELYDTLASPILADVWRVKSGLESKRDRLREIMYSKMREIDRGIPEEVKNYTRPEGVINVMVYFLWDWYCGVGKKVRRRIEKLLEINR